MGQLVSGYLDFAKRKSERKIPMTMEEEISEPIMREIRCLEKLIDDLTKGKSMEKIKRKG